MADNSMSPNTIVVDDRPLAVRRTRRGSNVAAPQIQDQSVTSSCKHGQQTPPATPKRSKRVRFSDPGSSTQATGLTPFISRTNLSTPISKHRHSSTPSTLRRNLHIDDTPISGTLQFAPLRQVLDGRVKRRLRRNGLSEEVNVIQWEKKAAAREKKSEIVRLRRELAAKDAEVQSLRDEQDIISQIEGEAGASAAGTTNSMLAARVEEQERMIQSLRAELLQKEAETQIAEDADWAPTAGDLFDHDDEDDDENDMMITNYDEAFSRLDDEVMTTPKRLNTSFNTAYASPPITSPIGPNTPKTPSRNISPLNIHTAVQVSLPVPDPEKEILISQLKTLKEEIEKLNAQNAFTTEHQARLTSKLAEYIPNGEDTATYDHTTLDAALDSVLTTLALSQTLALEKSTAFSALSTEIRSLGFGTRTTSPDDILSLIVSQFRQARLDFEYLAPGENVEGFENGKLLDMLINRLRYVSERVVKLDDCIDKYHEDEVLLREQLGARVSAMDEMRDQLREKESSHEKLCIALESYRTEVQGLEGLIERMEQEGEKHDAEMKVHLARKENQLLSDRQSHDETRRVKEEQEHLISTLESRLEAATASAAKIQEQLHVLSTSRDEILAATDSTIDELRTSSLSQEAEITNLNASLKAKDAQILSLEAEVGRLNVVVKKAEGAIGELKRYKERAGLAVQGMLEQMMRTSELGLGFLGEGEGDVAAENEDAVERQDRAAVVSRPGGLFDAGKAVKRRSGSLGASGSGSGSGSGSVSGHGTLGGAGTFGGKKKRRRYDSGLGFLEEEEGDETVTQTQTESMEL